MSESERNESEGESTSAPLNIGKWKEVYTRFVQIQDEVVKNPKFTK